jgi:hypothetical protein
VYVRNLLVSSVHTENMDTQEIMRQSVMHQRVRANQNRRLDKGRPQFSCSSPECVDGVDGMARILASSVPKLSMPPMVLGFHARVWTVT